MTYDQTNAVFEAMQDIETYSKMWQYEMDKDKSDWGTLDRYRDYITVARKKIFNLMEAPHAE